MVYSEDELAMLTDDERASIAEDEQAEEAVDTETADTAQAEQAAEEQSAEPEATATEQAGDEEEPPEVADGETEEAAADGTSEAETNDGTAENEPQEAEAEQQPTVAPNTAKLPDDYDTQVEQVATDKNALVEQFDEGDMSMADYHKQLDTLNRKERELERVADRVEYETKLAEDHWVNGTVRTFLSDHAQYNDNPVLLGLLDTEVRKLQMASDNPFDPVHLSMAHGEIKKALPQIFEQPTEHPGTQPAKKPVKKRDIPEVPSLANVPADDLGSVDDGKFASLDRLAQSDPIGFEQALAKMSDAERDEYLATSG